MESRRDSIFLKLDFSKAYDKVNWLFRFKVMKKSMMLNSIIDMIRLLFQNVVVSININNQVIKPFGIHKGARQGCPLPPYLFNIVGVKNVVRTDLLKIPSLFNAISNKPLVNMLKNTSLIMRAKESSVDNLVEILNNFRLASSLEMC